MALDDKDGDFLNWYRGDGARGEGAVSTAGVPVELRKRLDDPSNYRPTRNVRDAVNVALMMNLPLLITGEPGSGKTRLGYALAHELGLEQPNYFICKSTSEARDLFYTYDAIRHFHSTQLSQEETSAAPFIKLQALGKAIFDALGTEERERMGLLAEGEGQKRQSVVIVDEIDKAPADFANDLLFEFEELKFSLPELQYGTTPEVERAFRPILIITTNEQRALPTAFVRRCASVAIESPTGADLRQLIQQRFGDFLAGESPMFRDVLALFEDVRARSSGEYVPSVAELIDLFASLIAAGVDQDRTIWSQRARIWPFLTVFAKSNEVLSLIDQRFDEANQDSA